eukprot:4502523-Heterocapsa_arctica.AAC.1
MKKAMLKAKQIQSHKIIKTSKARQKHSEEEDNTEYRFEEETIDKSDTEDNSCVMKKSTSIKLTLTRKMIGTDTKNTIRILERAKAVEEREHNITNQIDTNQDIQQTERDDTETE